MPKEEKAGYTTNIHSLDISAVPKLFGVSAVVAAHAQTGLHPVFLVRGALARPGGRIKRVVPRVLAAVARVCVCVIGSHETRAVGVAMAVAGRG